MRFTIVILFLFPLMASGQIEDHFNDYIFKDSTSIKFGIRSRALNNSTALTANVLNSVMYGGYIDETQKKSMLNRANPINTTGSIWNSSVYVSKKIDSIKGKPQSDLHFFLNMADKQENLGVFTEEALKLVLNGNKQFAGQTISIDPLGFNSFQYKKFQIGFGKGFSNGNGISLGISFLYGQQNRQGLADRLDLIFSEYGDRISTDAEIDIYETEIAQSAFTYNGAGASIDIQGRFKVQLLPDSSNAGSFNFSISDLGFINWHGNSTHTKVDTFYSYQGTYIENIFDPNSESSGDPSNIWDSVSVKTNKSFTLQTPATIHFYLIQEYNNMIFTVGGAHRISAYYYPYFYGKFGYQLNSAFTVSGQINAGGYGNFGGGAEIAYSKTNFLLTLGSTNLEGFIAPTKWGGQSVYFQVAFKL
ncbi:MAG: hypothetical protein ACPGVC_10220 [Salibacteraceae bacterium]